MPSITIAAYFFNINSGKYIFDLGKLTKNKPFTELAYEYFKRNVGTYENLEKHEKIFNVERVEHGTATVEGKKLYHYFQGVIKSGAYGIESDIIDSESGTVDFQKEEKHAEVMPFNFGFYSPIQGDKGILIVQSVGIYGITTLMREQLTSMVHASIDPDAKVIFNNIAAKQYFTKLFEEGHLKSIRLFKYSAKKDSSQRIRTGAIESEYLEEIYHKPERFGKNLITQIIECFDKKYNINEVIGVEGQLYDNIKLDFRINKQNKVVSYSGYSNLVVSEDITKEVAPNGGHPDYVIIKPHMVKMAQSYMEITGIIASVADKEVEFNRVDYLEEEGDS